MQDATETGQDDNPPAIGGRLQALRKSRRLSLDGLAKISRVSKSMLSQIEREEANPTVAVMWRLTNALGVPLADFFTVGDADDAAPEVTITPPHATPEIKSPDGKCVLRILGPSEMVGRIEWYELRIQPGGILTSEPHQLDSKEHLSVLSGRMNLTVGDTRRTVAQGETARYGVDVRHSIGNDGPDLAIALMVVEYS